MLRILIVLFCLTLGSASSFAHHGTFTFDGERIITLEGTIIRFNWTNPHSSVVLSVQQPGGSTREIVIEADGPSILQPLGVYRDSLLPGDQVIAYVSPSKLSSSGVVLGREILKSDGTVIGLSVAYARQIEMGDLPEANSVLGTWVPDKGALFAFVQSSNTWPLTVAGQESLDAYDNTAPFAQTECIPATSPLLLMYPTAKVLEQQDDVITLVADWMGASRTIYMDDRPHPPKSETLLQGHSTGQWNEEVLEIDTTNFSENLIGNMFSVASGEDKHLMEWFSVNPDRKTMSYRFVLEDPNSLTEAVSGEYQWVYRPDLVPSDVSCDLETASRHLSE